MIARHSAREEVGVYENGGLVLDVGFGGVGDEDGPDGEELAEDEGVGGLCEVELDLHAISLGPSHLSLSPTSLQANPK